MAKFEIVITRAIYEYQHVTIERDTEEEAIAEAEALILTNDLPDEWDLDDISYEIDWLDVHPDQD
jgi:hypothetical protein